MGAEMGTQRARGMSREWGMPNGVCPSFSFSFRSPSFRFEALRSLSASSLSPLLLRPSCGQGPLLQHKKEHVLHGDLKRTDVVFQYTTTGWMMWNWLVGVLSVGATIVLFDGSPFKPDPLRIWRLVDELKCVHHTVRPGP